METSTVQLTQLLTKKGGLLTPRKLVVDSIECFQDNFDLIDIWRVKNPGIKSFTWSQKSPKIFRRLDYWLISNNLQDLVISPLLWKLARKIIK